MSVLSYIVDKLKTGLITFINAVTLANVDYPYADYQRISTTAIWKSYVVGTNAINSEGGARKLFVSKDTCFFATQDCYIRLNDSRAQNILIPANRPMIFLSNIFQVFVTRVTADGTIDMWFEGVLPEEARTYD